MTTVEVEVEVVDLSVTDGRDRKGVGDWLFAHPLEWRLDVRVMAIDPRRS